MKKYIKCPRCELNYILEDEQLCPVCKAELKLKGGADDLLDEDLELCPICGQNFITAEQSCCDECASKKKEENEQNGVDDEADGREGVQNDVDWDNATKDVFDEEIEVVPLSALEDDELFDGDDEDEEHEEGDEFDDGDEKDDFEDDFDVEIDEKDFDDDFDEEDDEDDEEDDDDNK